MTPDRRDKNDLRLAQPQDGEAFRIVEDAPRRRFGARAILFAGVAGACMLGVGLGLWARPGMAERRVAVVAPEPEAAADPAVAHTMKIVVNDGPAVQVGAPIETLRPAPKPLFATLRPRRDGQAVMGQVPELTRLQPKPLQMPHLETPHLETPKLPDLAPLMVAAMAAPSHWLEKLKPARPVETAAAAPSPPAHAKTAADTARRVQLAQATERAAKAAQAQAAEDAAREASERAADERAEAHRVALAEAAERKEEARQARLAEAKAQQASLVQAKFAQARLAQAKLVKAKLVQAQLAEAQASQVKAEKARLQQLELAQAKAKADKAEKRRLAKAEQAEARKLALAEARGRAEARAEAKAMVLAQARDEAKKRQRLEALVHAVQKVLPGARFTADGETARQDRRRPAASRNPHARNAEVERASLKARKAPRVVEPLSRSHPVQIAPAAPSGLMKVSTPRCASHDPGAALVCADPSLSAADRQMSRAYQAARGAGVPEAQLAAQQQRWLAARSAAAREAPWAMRDVYLARIAELNSQARDAHSDGY